jgi:hypothetical protein
MVSMISYAIYGIGAFIAYKAISIVLSKRSELANKGQDTGVKSLAMESLNHFAKARERDETNTQDLSGAAFGGQPQFFNEADCSKGRFLGWVRTDMDRADSRKIENGLYRAPVTQDVKYFWFFPGTKEVTTPCVFRPGIDSIHYTAGEKTGVPVEGMIVLKRSLDGQSIATGTTERYRSLLLDEKHKNGILQDMLIGLRDKERLAGLEDSSKESSEEMEKRLRRTKKIHDAASGRGGNDFMGGNPYGQEMYGPEPEPGPLGGEGSNTLWNFEQ